MKSKQHKSHSEKLEVIPSEENQFLLCYTNLIVLRYARFCILFLSPHQKKSDGLQVWIPSLNLLAEDNQTIEEGNWLSDRVRNAAQELLKSINISIGGLQNTLLAQNMQFTIERGRFVQILHVSGNRWITVSNNGCTGGEIKVYDCLGNSDLPEQTKQH